MNKAPFYTTALALFAAYGCASHPAAPPMQSQTALPPPTTAYRQYAPPSHAPVYSSPQRSYGAPFAMNGSTQVWVNTTSRVFHLPGSKEYGRTKHGQYMTEQAAVAAGYRQAKGEQ